VGCRCPAKQGHANGWLDYLAPFSLYIFENRVVTSPTEFPSTVCQGVRGGVYRVSKGEIFLIFVPIRHLNVFWGYRMDGNSLRNSF